MRLFNRLFRRNVTIESLPSNIVFLLGSGISYGAGMPSVETITKHVLHRGKPIVYNPDHGFYCFEDMVRKDRYIPDFGYVRRIVEFLERLEQEINAYYTYYKEAELLIRKANYEDIYFLASQIHDSAIHEYDNPAILSLIKNITPDIHQALSGIQDQDRPEHPWSIEQLADEGMKYIRHILWCFLSNIDDSVDLGYLDLFAQAVADRDLRSIDFFTLNNDAVFEQYLRQRKIEYFDGFSQGTDGKFWWNTTLFLQTTKPRIRLLKLHGSVNWYTDQHFGKGSKSIEKVDGAALPYIWRDLPEKAEPVFLAGTLNKMLDYTTEVFSLLQSEWFRSLYQSDVLVICGYGFNDKGINTRIVEWFNFSTNKILVVIDPSKDIIQKARPALGGLLARAETELRIQIIQKPLQEAKWHEARQAILNQMPD